MNGVGSPQIPEPHAGLERREIEDHTNVPGSKPDIAGDLSVRMALVSSVPVGDLEPLALIADPTFSEQFGGVLR